MSEMLWRAGSGCNSNVSATLCPPTLRTTMPSTYPPPALLCLLQAYIDFEIGEGNREGARELYERLLQRTRHVKVRWLAGCGVLGLVSGWGLALARAWGCCSAHSTSSCRCGLGLRVRAGCWSL